MALTRHLWQEQSKKKIDPKQIQRIQLKLDAIMRSIAQQITTDIEEQKCVKETGLHQLSGVHGEER